eukprot:gene28000-31096_t
MSNTQSEAPPNVSHSHHHEPSSAYPDDVDLEALKHRGEAGGGVADLIDSWVTPQDPVNISHTHHHETNVGMPSKVPDSAVQASHEPTVMGGVATSISTACGNVAKLFQPHETPANLSHAHHHESNIGMPSEIPEIAVKPHELPGGGIMDVIGTYLHPVPPANVSHVHHHEPNVGMPDKISDENLKTALGGNHGTGSPKAGLSYFHCVLGLLLIRSAMQLLPAADLPSSQPQHRQSKS